MTYIRVEGVGQRRSLEVEDGRGPEAVQTPADKDPVPFSA